jgi:hypothetical protein
MKIITRKFLKLSLIYTGVATLLHYEWQRYSIAAMQGKSMVSMSACLIFPFVYFLFLLGIYRSIMVRRFSKSSANNSGEKVIDLNRTEWFFVSLLALPLSWMVSAFIYGLFYGLTMSYSPIRQ